MAIMKDLKEHYILKGVGEPRYYLGGDVLQLGDEWEKEDISVGLSAETYVNNVLPRLASMCKVEQFKKYSTPFSEDYHAELDTTNLCGPEEISKYRSLIGSANWLITLGRFDIAYAVNTLSRYSAAPREGHVKAMMRVFGYIRQFPKAKICIDTSKAPIRNKIKVTRADTWSEFYPDASEEMPPDMPDAVGNEVMITVYVDADHARDKVNRRSVTGIILLINNTPLVWISKRQKTVETSTYGSELVAARIATELIIEMRYKLRMLGVRVEKTSLMIGDNASVVVNTTLPSSQLKKKHLAISYHRVRESIASGMLDFAHIPSEENIADICTKPLSAVAYHRLLQGYLYRRPKSTQTEE
jgi:hypothetical protein